MIAPLIIEPALAEAAQSAAAWPFEEARKLVSRLERTGKNEALFETGYGPSGLPHIGTFGEVARTSMVRHTFRVLTGDKVKTHLIAFSDDMDGLRKVPDNVPNRDLIAPHLGKPLSEVGRDKVAVRDVVRHLPQAVHVVREGDKVGLDLVAGENAEGVAHHRGAGDLAEGADMR